MTSRFEWSKQTEAHEAQMAAQTEALKRWLEKKHPGISTGEATIKAFREDMGGAFLTASDADWEYSLATSRTIFSRRRVPTEAEVKVDLIDEIMQALQSTNNPYWNATTAIARVKSEAAEQIKNRATANNLAFAIADAKEMVRKNIKNERAKMSFGNDWTVEKLRARLSQINDRQSQQTFTGAQLQDQLKQHRAAQQPNR